MESGGGGRGSGPLGDAAAEDPKVDGLGEVVVHARFETLGVSARSHPERKTKRERQSERKTKRGGWVGGVDGLTIMNSAHRSL